MQNIFDIISKPVKEILTPKLPMTGAPSPFASFNTKPVKLPAASSTPVYKSLSTPPTKLPALKKTTPPVQKQPAVLQSIIPKLSAPVSEVVGYDIAAGKTTTGKQPAPKSTAETLADLRKQDAKIVQAPRSTFDKLLSKLPDKIEGPVRSNVEDLKEGFLGTGDPFGTGTPDRGLIGFLFPYLNKGNEERVFPRYDALIEAGVSPERATEISTTYVRSTNPIARMRAEEKRKELNLSDEENKALRAQGIYDAVDQVFAGLDVISAGTTRIGRTAVQKIARSRNPVEIAEILKTEIKNISDEAAEKLSRLFSRIDNADDVETVLNRVDYNFNKAPAPGTAADETKAIATREAAPADTAVSKIPTEVPKGPAASIIPERAPGAAVEAALPGEKLPEGTLPAADSAPLTPAKVEAIFQDSEADDIYNYLADNAKTLTREQGAIQADMRAVLQDASRGLMTKSETQQALDELETRLRNTLTKREADDMTRNFIAKEGDEFNIDAAEGERRFRELFDTKETDFFIRDAIKGEEGVEILGRYTPATVFRNAVVEVVQRGGKVSDRVVYHEAFHNYLNEFVDAGERTRILENVAKSRLAKPKQNIYDKKIYDSASKRAEEWAADDFAAFVAGQKYNTANKSIYQKILEKIREWIRRATGLKSTYEKALAKDRSFKRNPARSDAGGSRFSGEARPSGDESLRPGEGQASKSSQNLPEAKRPTPEPATPSSQDSSLSSSKVNNMSQEKAIATTAKQLKEPEGTVRRVSKTLERVKTNVLEYVQDRTERVRQLVKRPDLKVDDTSDPFLKMTLYDGRVQARIEKAQDESAKLISEMKKVGEMTGEKVGQLRVKVSEYLIARHAPERNAALGEGAAGMTNAEAAAKLKEIESGPGGAEIKAIADQAQTLHNQTLEVLHDSGVISDELFSTLRNKYKNHIPLQRIIEGAEDVGPVLSGKGFDVKATGLKRAKGSQLEVNDILENIMLNHEQAVLRAEKNRVDLSTLAFVRKNKDALGGLMEETRLPIVPVAKVVHKGQIFPEVMEKVEELVNRYGGTIERKLKTGQVFGSYNPGTNHITTRFGTSKDTLVHEFGHLLDTKFGLKNDPGFFDSEISKELRKVADLRNGAQYYTRKGEEKIAEFIAMYFTDFKNAQRVAPKTTRKFTAFLADKPELRELVDTMKSRERAEEAIEEIIFARQQFTSDPTILSLFEKGKKAYVKIYDQKLAAALKGTNKQPLGSLFQAVGSFTRLYSGLNTRFNPEFALPNKIRDLQETAVYLASQKDIGFKGAASMVGKDTGSWKDVVDFLRGKDTPGAKLYEEMREAGGTTGGFGLSTKKQIAVNIDKLERLAESKTKRIANNLVQYIDDWNTIFEDSTRLSVYRQAREMGLSKERAAAMAKEASINFNRMGTNGPIINAIYMFSNASIQGSVKMMRSLKNPKVLAAVVAAVGGSVATVSTWNDQVDEKWREKVLKYDRLNGLVVVIPSTDEQFRYFTIPVSWGIKPIKVMADYAYDATSGADFTTKQMMEDTLTAIAEAYNPAGGSDLVSALMPTILDAPSEISRNKSWSGSKIRPDFDRNAPKDIQYFSSLDETATGRTAISISEMLQDGLGIAVSPADMKYAYDQYVGGAGRAASKTVNLFSGLATGKPAPLDEYPMVSRFYKERAPDEIGTNTGGEVDQIKDQLQDQSRDRFKTTKEAEAFLEKLPTMSKEAAAAALVDMKKNNPQLFDKIKTAAGEQAKGLTSTDKLIKQLGVSNGERASYILSKLRALDSNAAKALYLADLKKKGLLSGEVLEQMKKLTQ